MASDLPESIRRAECPNCGAPIAFRLASSRALVCGYCRFSVVRSDRDLRALGRIADLTPIASPLAVGDEGTVGGRAFRVLGLLQLDHGRGPWNELYLGFADQTWGWLARAEGRWYLTFACPCPEPLSWDNLTPGAPITLSGTGSVRWVVVERGGSAVVSAEGELPFRVDPQGSGRYVDLEGADGAFATLDFGDGSDPVQLFAGRSLAAHELSVTRTAVGPRPVERVSVAPLSCPTCGAPVPIFVPSACERVGCSACGALLDHAAGTLSLLVQLEPPPLTPLIPLGTEGSLRDEKLTVVGFMQRHVTVAGERFTFREYLLHGARGYTFLVEENHHWLFVSEVPASAVSERGREASYRGTRYRRFTRAAPEVDFVIGEFYWKVAVGDRSETTDFVAPPLVLSVERTEREVTWSQGEYIEPRALADAFGLRALPHPSGIAPAQPNPFTGKGHGRVLALLALIWLGLAFAYELRPGRKQVVFETDVALSPAGSPTSFGATSSGVASFSPPFTIAHGPTTLEIALRSPVQHGWVQVEATLVPEDGSAPRTLPLLVEHYEGIDGGEPWQEGGHTAEGYFGGVAAGTYVLRLVSQWEPAAGAARSEGPPALRVRATEGARSLACFFATLLLIGLPYVMRELRRAYFELRRNAEASA
jgi:hypothetical protein